MFLPSPPLHSPPSLFMKQSFPPPQSPKQTDFTFPRVDRRTDNDTADSSKREREIFCATATAHTLHLQREWKEGEREKKNEILSPFFLLRPCTYKQTNMQNIGTHAAVFPSFPSIQNFFLACSQSMKKKHWTVHTGSCSSGGGGTVSTVWSQYKYLSLCLSLSPSPLLSRGGRRAGESSSDIGKAQMMC